MQNFQRKQTEGKSGGLFQFREDFYFNAATPIQSFLSCWGIGSGVWENSYKAFFQGKSQHLSLELITEGSFQFRGDGYSETVQRGSLIWIDTAKKQSLEGNPGGKKWCLFFQFSEISGMIQQKIFGSQPILQLTGTEEIEMLYQNIYNAASVNSPDFEVEVFRLLKTLYRTSSRTCYPEPLNRVLKHFHKTADWWCSREELAEIAGVSISTLNRMFHRYLHYSIGEYCQKRRIDLACRLLSLPGISIKETADKCGFTSSAFFCRAFKKYKKCTPGEYIAQQD